jgi:hypothetical protein
LCASKNAKILDCILYCHILRRINIDIITANLQHEDEEGRMPEMDFVREKVNSRGLRGFNKYTVQCLNMNTDTDCTMDSFSFFFLFGTGFLPNSRIIKRTSSAILNTSDISVPLVYPL